MSHTAYPTHYEGALHNRVGAVATNHTFRYAGRKAASFATMGGLKRGTQRILSAPVTNGRNSVTGNLLTRRRDERAPGAVLKFRNLKNSVWRSMLRSNRIDPDFHPIFNNPYPFAYISRDF